VAYLVRRSNGTIQIRESVRLPKGPRSHTLASFSDVLSDRALNEAERKATRPFDRDALIEQAHRLGVGWESSTNAAARTLVMSLRTGEHLDPILVGLLNEELAKLPAAAVKGELSEAANWLGYPDHERGSALSNLLRLDDASLQSKGRLSSRRHQRYPTIDSGTGNAPRLGQRSA
jgi:hypothetical protein